MWSISINSVKGPSLGEEQERQTALKIEEGRKIAPKKIKLLNASQQPFLYPVWSYCACHL
jgi:hypothetical protein